jgi:hypothetical protein
VIDPKEIEINGKNFILSKFPAIAGREIVAKYPLSGLPKLGDYAVNEETMLKLMAYVAVDTGGQKLPLTTRALVDNHVGDWETLAKVEMAMLEYNCSFFQNGRIRSFFQDIAQKLPALISKILTDSLQALSQTEKPPTTN